MLKLLTCVYGNRLGQAVLESIVRKCQRYMGTGTGYLHPLPEDREIDEQFQTTNFAAIDNRG